MTLFEDIQKDLPHFPDEVIKDWLLLFANNYGWPPKNKKWESILFLKTVEFWKKIEWKKQKIDLSEIDFSQETTGILEDMKNAHIFNQSNAYTDTINLENGQRRYLRACKYIIQNGKFPKPICLLFEDCQYSIVDGNHRFFAWYYVLQITNTEKEEELEKLKKLQEKWKIESIAHISNKQEVWVAY